MKSLELKMTKSRCIKFEISPTMHFALNSLQSVLYVFRQSTVSVHLPEIAFFLRATFFCARNTQVHFFWSKNDHIQISQSKLPNHVTQQQFVRSHPEIKHKLGR